MLSPDLRATPQADQSDSGTRLVWFETRWGLAVFTVVVCLIGTGLLYYVSNYLARK